MIILSGEALIKGITKTLKQSGVNVLEAKRKGEDYEMNIQLLEDYDYPDYYKITIEREYI